MGNSVAMVVGEVEDVDHDFLELVLEAFTEIVLTFPFCAMSRACEILASGKTLEVIVIFGESEGDGAGCELLTRLKLCPQLANIPTVFACSNSEEPEGEFCSCRRSILDDDEDDEESYFNRRPPTPRGS